MLPYAEQTETQSPSGSMSSHDTQKPKKRRLHGACDACRKKKVKCDSAKMPGNECTNCRLAQIQCSHDIPRQPKKSEKQQEYIHILEQRVERLRHFIQTKFPNQDIDTLVDDDASEAEGSPASTHSTILGSNYPDFTYAGPRGVSTNAQSSTSRGPDDPSVETDDLAHIGLSDYLKRLSLQTTDDRFFGQSSVFMFVKHTATVRRQLTGTTTKPDPSKFRRPQFWDIHPWEWAHATLAEPNYIYPEPDLLESLVSLYFDKVNKLFPLLHQPTFRRSLAAGKHHEDTGFGMTVLLVCALGARYSQDTRVLMPGDTEWFSAGWRYFSQVPIHRNFLFYKASVYDLQYYALALLYFNGTGVPNTAWQVMGFAMRIALEKGAHRRKTNSQKPNAEDESIKRAFWCMLWIDRYMASFLGRPCLIQDEDYDVDFPIECDDEYWETEDPSQAFKQPAGKPCTISAFVCGLRLCEILGFANRTLYSTKKSKALSGLIGQEWENRIVSELTTSMTKWKENLPYFLRWNPDMPESIFFHQSASLHATFYYIQIQIHRPFLSKKSSLSIPALAMCTNASRATAHVVEAVSTRGVRFFPNLIMAAVSAGLVAILNLWGNQHSGLGGDPRVEMADLERCLNFLKGCERRWHMAGRMCDMLNEVASLTDYQPTINKRRRDDAEISAQPSNFNPPNPPNPPPPPRNVPEPPTQMPMGGNIHPSPPSANFAPPPTFNAPAPAFMNDWDLSNLLLTQMNYIQSNIDSGFNAQPQHLDTTLHIHPSAGYARNLPTHNIVPLSDPGLTQDDMFALWSDMDATFTSSDQWNNYLQVVNIGKY